MTFYCYHCGCELDTADVPAEVLADWEAGSTAFAGLCEVCEPGGDPRATPVAV